MTIAARRDNVLYDSAVEIGSLGLLRRSAGFLKVTTFWVDGLLGKITVLWELHVYDRWVLFSPNSGYTEGVLTVRVKAGCSLEVLALGRWFRLRRNAVLRFYVDFDCAGSHKVAVPIFTISKASFYRVLVYVFGHERHFAWQVQGIRHLWRSETWVDREILHKRSSYRDLAQEVLEDLDADITTERSWKRDPQTEILHKRSYRILMQTSWQRDLAQEIRRQRSCTRGPTGSWCRHHDREILDKRSADRDLAQEVLQDPDADMMTERSCTRDSQTEILHKRSYRILMQTWQRDLGQEIRRQRSCTRGHTGSRCRHHDTDLAQEICRQRSCTRGHTGSWCRHHDREILHKRFSDRDLAQEVLQDPDADIMTERSGTRDPQTEILHKRSHRILMQTSWQRDLGQEILIQRSCASGPAGSWCRHHGRKILHKRSADRDLAQEVLQDPDADIMTERSWPRDPHTEILHNRFYRILMQTSWQRDLAQEIHIQRSWPSGPIQDPDADIMTEILHKRSADRDLAQEVLQDPDADIMTERSWTRDPQTEISTRGPTGSWCRHHDREILDKRSADRDLAQEVLQDPDADIMTERSCTRDFQTEISHKRSYRIPMQTSWHRSCTRDLQTEILRKRSYRILMQTSWQRDLGQEIRRQILHKRSYRILGDLDKDPHAPILHNQVVLLLRSWRRDPERAILDKRPAYRDLAQVALEAADAETLTKTSCRSSTTGFWCTDPHTDLASTISNKKTPQHCLGSLAGIIFFPEELEPINAEQPMVYREQVLFGSLEDYGNTTGKPKASAPTRHPNALPSEAVRTWELLRWWAGARSWWATGSVEMVPKWAVR